MFLTTPVGGGGHEVSIVVVVVNKICCSVGHEVCIMTTTTTTTPGNIKCAVSLVTGHILLIMNISLYARRTLDNGPINKPCPLCEKFTNNFNYREHLKSKRPNAFANENQ